jgi:endonuclease-3 related protein
MNKLIEIYDHLHSHYGNLSWWPAETPYEVIVGAVLTQNTAWTNVEKAIANFKAELSPDLILNLSHEELIKIINPAGFFNQKARYLKNVTSWFSNYAFDVSVVQKKDIKTLRTELLNIKGVGRETADSILLYAFEFPTFVVDAYTVRLLKRFPIEIKYDYEVIRAYFEDSIPKDIDLYNNYHALIVINGKNHCRKRPVCTGCPLYNQCERKEI